MTGSATAKKARPAPRKSRKRPDPGRAERERRAGPPERAQHWSLYIIRCRGGALYTGIATDVDRRLAEHRAGDGRGARYLRGRGPLKIVLRQPIESKSLALRLERRIKRLSKARKEALVAKPGLLDRIRIGIASSSAR